MNRLLELRGVFCQRNLNKVFGEFYRLLPRLQRSDFLLGYRIRKWLALHFDVEQSDPLGRIRAKVVALPSSMTALKDARIYGMQTVAREVGCHRDLRLTVQHRRSTVCAK